MKKIDTNCTEIIMHRTVDSLSTNIDKLMYSSWVVTIYCMLTMFLFLSRRRDGFFLCGNFIARAGNRQTWGPTALC